MHDSYNMRHFEIYALESIEGAKLYMQLVKAVQNDDTEKVALLIKRLSIKMDCDGWASGNRL